ncbi:MAG: methylenetetrahydrofolate reductase [Candidatus Freyarchaeota archaeon]|nr:methylenetetrahydrofolate reductase [Candidatus Jordarchaeia archaeon]
MIMLELREFLGKGFTLIGQVDSARTVDAGAIVSAVKSMGKVQAVIVSEPQGVLGAANTAVVSGIVKRETEVEVVCQITCRDRNRAALVSDVLAAKMLGVDCFLITGGGHPKLSDTPQAMAVFDLDPAQLVQMLKHLSEKGETPAGHKVSGPLNLCVGAMASPATSPIDVEAKRLERMARIGLDFIVTYPTFSLEALRSFKREVKQLNVPVVVGVRMLPDVRDARRLNEDPRVTVPPELIDALERAERLKGEEKVEACLEANLNFFEGFLKAIKEEGFAGCSIHAPGMEHAVGQLASKLKN